MALTGIWTKIKMLKMYEAYCIHDIDGIASNYL